MRLDQEERNVVVGQYSWFSGSGSLLRCKVSWLREDVFMRQGCVHVDGMLAKHPLIVGNDYVLTGIEEKEWKTKLL